MKMLRIVDVSSNEIVEYNENTVALFLERNASRYFMPEDISLGVDATKQQRLDLQNAILFNQGKALVSSDNFHDVADAKQVVFMLNDKVAKLEDRVKELETENAELKNTLIRVSQAATQENQVFKVKSDTIEKTDIEVAEQIEDNSEMTDEQIAENDRAALDELTVPELKLFAEKEGIDITKRLKAEIIDEIVKASATQSA